MNILLLLASLLLTQQTGRPEFGNVRGQIRSADGTAAAGIRVTAMAIEENGVVDPAAATLSSLGETDSEGRFHLENIPPGRYLITAGFLDFPSYYPGVRTHEEARSIAVVAGGTVSNIDFTVVRSGGVRIRGRLKSFPATAPAGMVRVGLQFVGNPLFRPIDIGVAGDGTFEFSKVPPGSYTLRISPTATSVRPLSVEIGEEDIDGLELTAPLLVAGRVTLDDGSPLPFQAAALAAGVQDAPALLRLQANSGDQVSGIGVSSAVTVRRDGVFILPFPGAGDYRIAPTLMPLRHDIQSMTYGNVDLLQSPLKIESESGTTELRIVLTTTRPAGTPAGVKVSGRVTGLENNSQGAPLFVSLQSQTLAPNQLMVNRITEAPVEPDGTFEVTGVPPARYTVRAASAPGLATGMAAVIASSVNASIDVTNKDVSGLELALRIPADLQPGAVATVSFGRAPQAVTTTPTLTVSQNGQSSMYREGAVTFFRVDLSGFTLEDKRLEGSSANFTLTPGNYELRSYVRPCRGNCDRELDPPRDECVAPFTLVAGQTLHAERVIRGATCTIQFRLRP